MLIRRGRNTSEFAVTALVVAGNFIASLEGALPAKYAAIAAAVAGGLYAVSRGLAKNGRSSQ